ncbi:MAG: hypothetical protein A2Y33_00315 [Spirochaetes bacterium GWF1_51_8]|nr:MAG: hypothetical protein A2Y33_00315 [Spirochaetes bacterium GWF1_51_8]
MRDPESKPVKQRLDVLLFEKGLFDSREKAHAEILAGNVLIDETLVTKPGNKFFPDAAVRIKEKFPYVGRGALKLLRAFEYFALDIHGLPAIDVGASTGGFTEVLLEKGASVVYAVDVGTNQLAWKLRSDPRVRCMEKTHAADLPSIVFDPPPVFAVVDVSFISLTRIFEPLVKVLTGDFRIVTLIKPQFELKREQISKGGIARPEFRDKAVENVLEFARRIGLDHSDVIESPISGARSRNVEYLAMFRKSRS